MPRDAADRPVHYEDVSVGWGPPLRIEFADVPISLVDLDPDNPRLRYRSTLFDANVTAESVLLAEQATKHLLEDIELNGMLDRPYVKRKGERYVAKEGNRRTTVIKALHKKAPEDKRWQTIAVRILPDNTTEEQMATMLAQWHVTGKEPWSAHERAGHIYHMAKELHMSDETIKTILHMGMPAINKAVRAYTMLMEKFIKADNGAYARYAEGRFSYFDELFKSKGLVPRLKDDSFFEGDFCTWVGTSRIPRAEDVRMLNAVLNKGMAERLFRESENSPPGEPFRRAVAALENEDPTQKSDVFVKIRAMIAACGNATVKDFNTAATDKGQKLLKDARAMIDAINRHAENTRSLL